MIIADDVWQRRPEHGDRRAVDHARPVALIAGTDGVEQHPRGIEVHAVALLEIVLRLAGDHRGQVKDDVGAARHDRGRHPRLGQISHRALHDEARIPRRLGDDKINERQLRDALGPQTAVAHQPLHELAAQHPRRADNQNPHPPRRIVGLDAPVTAGSEGRGKPSGSGSQCPGREPGGGTTSEPAPRCRRPCSRPRCLSTCHRGLG